MQSFGHIINNEDGFVMVLALLMLVVVLSLGLAGNVSTNMELQISGNDRRIKQNLFAVEGGGFEVAGDINRAGPEAIAECIVLAATNANVRSSCLQNYAVIDIEKKTLMTDVDWDPGVADLDSPNTVEFNNEINDVKDTAWPINYQGENYPAARQSREYGYRVYYWGMGAPPKGYGTGFGSYVFDITTRKQETSGGNTENLSTIIRQGFVKIGPAG